MVSVHTCADTAIASRSFKPLATTDREIVCEACGAKVATRHSILALRALEACSTQSEGNAPTCNVPERMERSARSRGSVTDCVSPRFLTPIAAAVALPET